MPRSDARGGRVLVARVLVLALAVSGRASCRSVRVDADVVIDGLVHSDLHLSKRQKFSVAPDPGAAACSTSDKEAASDFARHTTSLLTAVPKWKESPFWE